MTEQKNFPFGLTYRNLRNLHKSKSISTILNPLFPLAVNKLSIFFKYSINTSIGHPDPTISKNEINNIDFYKRKRKKMHYAGIETFEN